METVSVQEFRRNLAGYLHKVREGIEIIVTARGEAVARLVPPVSPVSPERGRQPGGLAGRIWMAPDFDETPVDIIAIMEGKDG
ncbi:MAG: hypothetical protein FD149_440 [Rhodospirillaceae bacterium]|nr:MAG: hypothetical protein FD149_440 [Rhodospirillaceae bacterium]